MALTANVGVVAQSEYTKANDLSTTKDQVALAISLPFTEGTGDDQADRLFHDKRTLGDGASENLDLSGSLADVYGATLTFVKIKAMIIQNLSSARTLTIGNASSNAFINWVGGTTHMVNIPPGGVLALVAPKAGFAVTAGTGDILKVLNSAGGACDYHIWIIGTSA
jgi:hypothetical protein